jgi:hypothetical protein
MPSVTVLHRDGIPVVLPGYALPSASVLWLGDLELLIIVLLNVTWLSINGVQ